LTDTKFLRFKVFKKLSFSATWQSERTDFWKDWSASWKALFG
jgi:hypothetical protein